jgi:ATP-dependent Lhr-like helicase
MNDYGFELLSDKPIPIVEALDNDLFTTDHLEEDIRASINSAEMASRKFRDIAHIAGLIFRGYPGRPVKEKHLQASTGLLFRVFSEYDPENLLLKQAYEEVFNQQLEEVRLREALQRIQSSKIVLMRPDRPTPFSFPIMVDRLRERLSSEKLEDRIRRMTLQLERS